MEVLPNTMLCAYYLQTPKIVEAHKCALDLPPSPVGDVILEGTLGCKLAMTDGKVRLLYISTVLNPSKIKRVTCI